MAIRLLPAWTKIGVTSDLFGRAVIHKQDLIEGFTKRYGVHQVVYYEMHLTMDAAIVREKRLKKWNRAWKIRLIEEDNPHWDDLYVQSISPSAQTPCSWVPDTRFAGSGMTPKWIGPMR